MSSVSRSQQKLFGIVHALQKGEGKGASPKVKKIAKSIKPSDAEDFASTKHKGLPEKVKPKAKKKKSKKSGKKGTKKCFSEWMKTREEELLNEAKKEKKSDKWMQKASEKIEKKGTEGSFTAYCKKKGYDGVTDECIEKGIKAGGKTAKKAAFAKAARKVAKD